MRQLARYERRRSRPAVWSRRLGIFALVLALVAILLNRADILDPLAAVSSFTIVSLLAALAAVLGFGGIVRIWHRGHLGLGSALTGLFIGCAILAWPAFLAVESVRMPMINDIATDWSDPPEMRAAVRDRTRLSNPVRMPTARQVEAQRAAYPEIGPLVVNFPSQRVYQAATLLADERGWRILVSLPPDFEAPGRLEMVARTPVLGFKDDVVVIITNLGDGRTRVDMRSASRFGSHDFGKNARRIYDFLTALDEMLRSGVPLSGGVSSGETGPQS